ALLYLQLSANIEQLSQDSDPALLDSYVNLKSLVPDVDEAIDEDSEVPRLPPACVQGFLSNGLTYFVMQNHEPKSRAELFLVVGFGSLVEDDEERGIAHIIEHLGFSATKAYENHAIVKFLESIGAPFGACQNAYTSFDRTVYTLHVPTDKDGVLEESLKLDAKREKRSKASKKSRKDKKKRSSKRKHGKHAKAKKSKKDKKKKDKKSEDEPLWKKEPVKRWQSWQWRSQSSGSDWKKKSDEDGSWKADDWKSQRGWNSGGSWKQSNWNCKRGYGAPKGQAPKVKARPSTKDDDMEADWDYWSIAIENCKNDGHRVASPAEARDTGAAIVLDDAYDDDVCERILGELETAYQDTVPGSLLKKLSEALVKSQRAWPDIENSLLMEGGGWSALVVPVFDGQGPTRKPLTSEFHRDVPEQDAYPYSFAHGTSFGSLPYIMAEGMIRPQNWSVLPSLGFFGIACMGWLENDKDSEVLKQLLNNALSIGKGQQDALVLGSADKRNEAFHKILSLLHAFSTFFDLASLLEDDENEGDSLPRAYVLRVAGQIEQFPAVWGKGGLDFCSVCFEDAPDRGLDLGQESVGPGPSTDGGGGVTVAFHRTRQKDVLDAQRRRILPLVIPGIGIGQAPFGQLLLDIRNEAGLRNDEVDKPFLPAPLPNGEWSSDPLSSSEITRWLRFLLPRPSSEKQLSSHSLKVTTLVWCSRFGITRETKRVLGHRADAASGSDAVYGRELQSAALREYILILEAIAAGQFWPDRTRSGHFAPGWSREAILKATAAAPAAMVQSTDIAEDEDEALAVVSDDSDSDADDTDMPLYWAHPTSQILHRKVLREFAYFTRISDEDLDKERKVVLEEWRESRNAQGRLSERYIQEHIIRAVSSQTLRRFYQKFYHPARMALVAVGDFDAPWVEMRIKELFDILPEDSTFLHFPDARWLQHLSVRGMRHVDIAVSWSVGGGRRSRSASKRKRQPGLAFALREGTLSKLDVRVASSTDPELSFAQSMIDCKRPRTPVRFVRDVRRRITEDLFHRAFSARLLRLTLQGPLEGGPRDFFSAGTDTSDPLPALSPLSASLAPLPGRVRPAIASLLRELERIRRFGFHVAEVLRAKRSMLAEFEEEYIEREQRPSDGFAEELTSFFLDEDHAPGVEDRARLASVLLPRISSEEVSNVSKLYIFEDNVVVKIATPLMSLRSPAYTAWSTLQACRQFRIPRPSLDLPSEEEVTQLMQAVATEQLKAWPADEDDVDSRLKLLFDATASDRLANVSQTRRRQVQALGVPTASRKSTTATATVTPGSPDDFGEEVILQNGFRVFLKETDLFQDEILVKGRRWGGLSEFQESGMFSGGVSCEAQVNSMCAMMLGICGLPAESMQECLEGRRVDPSPPSMEAYTTSLDASSSPADFEVLLTLLALLFLKSVSPGQGTAGRLSLVKLGLLAWRLAEDRDPQSKFRRRLQSAITSNHPYTWLPSLWRILRLNFRIASQIFNERASMPREWTLVLVGRLPPRSELLPLLETYLGSIPNGESGASSQRPEDLQMRQAVTPLEIEFPATSVREDVHLHMVEPKGSTVLCFPLQMVSVSEAESAEACSEELRELMRLQLLVRLLETRLVEVLRFQRGQVYSVSVGTDLSLAPPQMGKPRRGTLSISFECDPAESDELVAATQAELDCLKDGSTEFTEANVAAALEQDSREFEELIHTNGWWAGTMLDLYFSRCYVAFGEIGQTVSLWWTCRQDVLQTYKVAEAIKQLRDVLATARSVTVAMRPKSQVAATPTT
ncbi:unnamed protein product, partial [Symbiodinium sp. CCMP2456]